MPETPPLPIGAPGEPVAFAVNPLEAIGYLARKLRLPTQTWTDIWEAAHAASFVVAGAQTDDLLADFQAAVQAAIDTGRTLQQFREDFDRIVAEHGWSYRGSRNWRSKVIYQTNMRMAVAAGRWEQVQRVKASRPYLRYVAVMDERTRPMHALWHNTILAVDDPWWHTHFPPNGWNCRCTVQSLNARDLDRYGLTVSDEAPPIELVEKTVKGRGVVLVPEGIDPGFAYNPGIAGLAVRDGGGVALQAGFRADQPRHPRGSPEGGEWSGGPGGGSKASPPPEKVAVTRKAVEENFAVAKPEDGGPTDPDAVAAFWEQHGLPPPAEVKAALLGPLPDRDFASTVYVDGDTIYFSFFDGNGTTMDRSIDLGDKVANHEYLELREGEQGAGTAKALLASQVALYKRLGVERIELTANIDVGGYAWARYGFKPDDEAWEALKPRLLSNVDALARHHVDGATAAAVKRVIEDAETPEAIWDIADMRLPTRSAKQNTVGKYLLAGTSWRGALDLGDADAMQRFDRYVH